MYLDRMRIFFIIILLFGCNYLFSQEVTIIDVDTDLPIQHCVIYGDKNKEVVLTAMGKPK